MQVVYCMWRFTLGNHYKTEWQKKKKKTEDKILAYFFLKNNCKAQKYEYNNNSDILSYTENRNIKDLLDQTCEHCMLSIESGGGHTVVSGSL